MEKALLKKAIAKYYPLYQMHGSRLKRLMYSPAHTGLFYIKNLLAHLRPYKVTKRMPWGARMSFYLPEGNQIYYYDFWELGLANFVIDFLKEGDSFIDIGSHVGYYASLAGSLVGPLGTVVAIEPTPRTFSNLKNNLLPFPGAKALNVAVSDRSGFLNFYDYGPAYSAFNSFTKRESLGNTKLKPDIVRVETITLDEIVRKYAPKATLIKIDAEGAESDILKGGLNTLKDLRPVITVEVGGYEDWSKSTAETLKLLTDSNYRLYTTETSGSLTPYDSQVVSGYDNLVAVPAEKSYLNP